MPGSKFVRLKCPRCKNSQVSFSRASLFVKCLVCKKLLLRPLGGKARARARVVSIKSVKFSGGVS